MTTPTNSPDKEALLASARHLKDLLEKSIPRELALSAANQRYEAACKLFPETYRAWEQATSVVLTAEASLALLEQAKAAADLAVRAQSEKTQEASQALWRACFSGDESEILVAAAHYAGQTRVREQKTAQNNEASMAFYTARNRVGHLRDAQRKAHDAHIKTVRDIAAAETELHSIEQQYPGSNHELFSAEQSVAGWACQFAGGALDGNHYISGKSALELALTIADLPPPSESKD